jgi:hypothetical protein
MVNNAQDDDATNSLGVTIPFAISPSDYMCYGLQCAVICFLGYGIISGLTFLFRIAAVMSYGAP